MKKNYVKKCLALTLAFSMTFSTVAFADTAKDTYTNEQGSGENGTIEPGARDNRTRNHGARDNRTGNHNSGRIRTGKSGKTLRLVYR